jgi:hypothetical protein
VKDFLSLKKERGQLSDSELDRRLRESVLVPFDHLIVEYQDKKFVDHPPPLPYLLQIIWDLLFTRYAADVVKPEGEKSVNFSVTVKKVTEDLQTYYGFQSGGNRNPEIPRLSWVRQALDSLGRFGMAKHVSPDDYLIQYKRSHTDTLKKFGKLCFKAEQKKPRTSSKQLSLLPPPI